VTEVADWLRVQPIAAERVPDLVASIVVAGVRVHAVEPGRASLEERFLGLVGRGDHERGGGVSE